MALLGLSAANRDLAVPDPYLLYSFQTFCKEKSLFTEENRDLLDSFAAFWWR